MLTIWIRMSIVKVNKLNFFILNIMSQISITSKSSIVRYLPGSIMSPMYSANRLKRPFLFIESHLSGIHKMREVLASPSLSYLPAPLWPAIWVNYEKFAALIGYWTGALSVWIPVSCIFPQNKCNQHVCPYVLGKESRKNTANSEFAT